MSLVEMPLKFSVDPQTGVIVPPVTVFNGGKRSSLSGKRKSKTRKSKKSKKTRKATRRNRRR